MNWFFNALSKHLAQEVSKSSGDDGCYIATMVYGDYEHPSVLQLREFRDRILLKNSFGELFVLSYYYISPKFVSRFSDKNTLKLFMKTTLNYLLRI
ncbi:MAG: CFI-box-CTERM domain-containing protein [Bacteroidales bacterium]